MDKDNKNSDAVILVLKDLLQSPPEWLLDLFYQLVDSRLPVALEFLEKKRLDQFREKCVEIDQIAREAICQIYPSCPIPPSESGD